MEEQRRKATEQRASVIGGEIRSEIGDEAFGSWALRAARSEHQLQSQKEDLAQFQNARISALLGEMRPRMSVGSVANHYNHPFPPNRKAHTTNVVDAAQVNARNAIYGSWQERRPSRLYGSSQQMTSSTLPKYDQLYCNTTPASSTSTIATTGFRREPPEYGKVNRAISSWQVTASDHRPTQAGWLKNSRPLARGALSPAAYFMELENRNGAQSPIVGGLSVVAVPTTSSTGTGSQRNSVIDAENAPDSSLLQRNNPRQASFMAAVQRHPLKENNSIDEAPPTSSSSASETQTSEPVEKVPKEIPEEIRETPMRRVSRRDGSLRSRQSSKSMGRLDFDKLRIARVADTTSSDSSSDLTEAMKMIRRQRPKSYVLATSASMQDDVLTSIGSSNDPSSSISHDTTTSGRELPSSLMGSSTSIEPSSSASHTGQQTSRSLNAPHPPATHRLQRFIALFNSNKTSDGSEPKKGRMKRSRTSLPASRFSLPGTVIQRDAVDRQTWVKHQEIALGKSGKRNHWEDRWAVLSRRSLYLCIESPAYTTEKTVELGAHTRVDVCNAIVDIAYDWLSATFSKQRHVVRIVTQNRSEHLIELNTESEMLSWISVLQSSSEDEVGGVENRHVASATTALHNSQSIASLASSSCSTTTSELVTSSTSHHHHLHLQNNSQLTHNSSQQNLPTNELSATATSHLSTSKSFGGLATNTQENAKNRLIMHRYIAKNSQLQSPTAAKKMEVDPSAPSTSSTVPQCANSQSGPSTENGDPATTPKSGRKWKKSKAAKQGSGGGSSGSSSGSQPPQPVLGVRLADCPTGHCEDHVPMLVQICVSVVETHGMDTVGIYRIPGNTAAVNALKESLSSRGFDSIDLTKIESLDPRWRDVNVVSSLLKMFLRKLPEPLLTDKLYPFFIDANRISTHHNRLHKLRNLLRKLPRPHYDTLRFLILHLAEITRHSDVNKMECRNLALMFGPSIVRPSDDNMATMVTHMSDQCKIIETLIHYNVWMFDESSTTEDAVPEQHPADGANPLEPGSYGVGVPTGVSAASFNDMHNLIRKANEDQAAAMMNEGKGQKIKNMLRRNSRRDKSKGKLKIESTAAAAVNPNPRGAYTQPTASTASVESAFCGNYQERDIDAEIESRQTISPQMTSGGSVEESRIDQSPSLESSLGSLPDTSRTEPTGDSEEKEAARRRRQEEMHSARRMFIAGTGNPAVTEDKEKEKALADHSQHLHLASSPAFEVLSEETREKIRKMQKKQSWHDSKELRSNEMLKTYSPTKDLTDALSCTSDYSTTSSAPLSTNPPLAVACGADQPNSSSDYASSDPSPCARNPSTSPAARPSNLGLTPAATPAAQQPMSRSQKIRLRTKLGVRDPTRRHTLSDVDTLKEGRLDKLARWFGIRKSSPDVSRDEPSDEEPKQTAPPPVIVKTSPNELTPVSGDEQL